MTETEMDFVTYCSNYQKIIDFGYLHKDSISKNLIQSYQDYLGSQDETTINLRELKELDEILGTYVDNHHFFHFVQDNYYSDDLPYYLEFTNELKRLKNNYDLLSGMLNEKTRWL